MNCNEPGYEVYTAVNMTRQQGCTQGNSPAGCTQGSSPGCTRPLPMANCNQLHAEDTTYSH